MNDTDDNAARAAHASAVDHRRWLIGVAISVAFGTFGAVMAWLSYTARSQPPAPSTAQAAKPASEKADQRPSRRSDGTGHR